MFRLTVALTAVAAGAIGALGAGATSSATPVGWSTTKAASMVQAGVHVPWCRVWVNSKDRYGQPTCVNGRAVAPETKAKAPLPVANVVCTGLVAAPGGFRQLRCSWAWNNDASERGTLLVVVAGPKTFRWKSL